MASNELAWIGDEKPLPLTRGQDYAVIVKPKGGGTFPPDTRAKIVFYLDPTSGDPIATWTATVDRLQAVWREESEVADEIPDRAAYYMYFSFPDSPRLDLCRFYGQVSRRQPASGR